MKRIIEYLFLIVRNPAALYRRVRDERRELGWGGLVRKRGWVVLALVVLFYLVRDTLLYIALPLAAAAAAGMRP